MGKCLSHAWLFGHVLPAQPSPVMRLFCHVNVKAMPPLQKVLKPLQAKLECPDTLHILGKQNQNIGLLHHGWTVAAMTAWYSLSISVAQYGSAKIALIYDKILQQAIEVDMIQACTSMTAGGSSRWN